MGPRLPDFLVHTCTKFGMYVYTNDHKYTPTDHKNAPNSHKNAPNSDKICQTFPFQDLQKYNICLAKIPSGKKRPMMGPSYLNFKPPRRTGFILKTCDGSCINETQSLRSVLISVVFKAPKEVK
jgi:hypothetical protein